jgi:hypothetical protein
VLQPKPAIMLLVAGPCGEIGTLHGIKAHRELVGGERVEQHRDELALLLGDRRSWRTLSEPTELLDQNTIAHLASLRCWRIQVSQSVPGGTD